MSTVAQLEFEHTHYNVTVQHVSHCDIGTAPNPDEVSNQVETRI